MFTITAASAAARHRDTSSSGKPDITSIVDEELRQHAEKQKHLHQHEGGSSSSSSSRDADKAPHTRSTSLVGAYINSNGAGAGTGRHAAGASKGHHTHHAEPSHVHIDLTDDEAEGAPRSCCTVM